MGKQFERVMRQIDISLQGTTVQEKAAHDVFSELAFTQLLSLREDFFEIQ
jgi:hypothetical protein